VELDAREQLAREKGLQYIGLDGTVGIIAELKVTQGTELSATAAKTELPLCPRCRRHEPVLESGLCARCDEVVA